MSSPRLVIAGGGAAGFFAAIAAAEAAREAEVVLLEKDSRFLTKVRISGGGRCNVTHSCFEPRALSPRYPRGAEALIAPFHRFQASDTVEWFAARGVELKTESDGRMFPVTDSSETIIACLMRAAEEAGVEFHTRRGLEAAAPREAGGGFDLKLSGGEQMACDRLLLATGGCRARAAGELAVSLGHSLEPPVPSLFSFHVETPWLRELAGVSVDSAEVSVPGTRLRETGPLLITHLGLSGPAILRISAWGARVLHGLDYRFPLRIHWLPGWDQEKLAAELRARREAQPGALVANTPVGGLPARLWKKLVEQAGIAPGTRWSILPREGLHRLCGQIARGEFEVTGKSPNKAEFVTCGGVRLREVDLKTMESRIQPGLYFAGELLDIDGITGGFNFQAAWTTGWIAGHAMAAASK